MTVLTPRTAFYRHSWHANQAYPDKAHLLFKLAEATAEKPEGTITDAC